MFETELTERLRVERDLHDDVGQQLLTVAANLDAVGRQTAESSTEQVLATVSEELRETIDELRNIAGSIRRPELRESGIKVAVEAVAEILPLDVEVTAGSERYPELVELMAYSVVCEALASFAGQSTTRTVSVEITETGWSAAPHDRRRWPERHRRVPPQRPHRRSRWRRGHGRKSVRQ